MLATLMGKLGRKILNESILAITAIKLAINYFFVWTYILKLWITSTNNWQIKVEIVKYIE